MNDVTSAHNLDGNPLNRPAGAFSVPFGTFPPSHDVNASGGDFSSSREAIRVARLASLDAVRTHLSGAAEVRDAIATAVADGAIGHFTVGKRPVPTMFEAQIADGERMMAESRERYWRNREAEASELLLEARAALVRAADEIATLSSECDRLRGCAGEEWKAGETVGSVVRVIPDDCYLADVIAERDAAASNARSQGSSADTLYTLVQAAKPSVRLVNDWATWSDASLYAYADAILAKYRYDRDLHGESPRDAMFEALAEIRTAARDRLGDNGFTIPPTYTEEQREAAIKAIERYDSGMRPGGFMYAWVDTAKRSLIDDVATALGMRRAGASTAPRQCPHGEPLGRCADCVREHDEATR